MMHRCLRLQLRYGNGIVLRHADEELSTLQRLIGGRLLSDCAEAADAEYDVGNGASDDCAYERTGARGVWWSGAKRGFRLALDDCVSQAEKVIALRRLLIHGCMAAEMRGEKLCLVHGALLENESGEAIMLCGYSGMGKSTTAARWRREGGKSPSDDMALLEYDDGHFFVHPLPTWSRCLVDMSRESVCFEKSLPLRAVLALDRGEALEEVKEIDSNAYKFALYGACSYFHLDWSRHFQAALQARLYANIRRTVECLFSQYHPLALFAHLGGNLHSALRL